MARQACEMREEARQIELFRKGEISHCPLSKPRTVDNNSPFIREVWVIRGTCALGNFQVQPIFNNTGWDLCSFFVVGIAAADDRVTGKCVRQFIRVVLILLQMAIWT
jgi:hypothetical protein